MDTWRYLQPPIPRFGRLDSESDAFFREKLRRSLCMWWADIMAEQDVFIVPEPVVDATTDAYTYPEPYLISAQEKEDLYAPGASIEDHLVVASVFAQVGKLPGDLTCRIFEFVGLLLTFEVETDEHRGGHNDMDDVYLTLHLPTEASLALPRGVAVGPCVNLTAECCSHDQGWATFDREHNGTYRESYTWSEVAVATSTMTPSTSGHTEHTDTEAEAGERVEIARATVSSNLRARNYFRHHCKQFRDRAGILQHVALGEQVELRLRSQFPGWTNTAKFGRLRAQFLMRLDDDFECFTWKQLREIEARRNDANDRWCSIQ